MNAGKVSLLRSQSDAREFVDKTRTLSTIICKGSDETSRLAGWQPLAPRDVFRLY